MKKKNQGCTHNNGTEAHRAKTFQITKKKKVHSGVGQNQKKIYPDLNRA